MAGAAVRVSDLDDFITPSQACINPLFTSSDERPPETIPKVSSINEGNRSRNVEKLVIGQGSNIPLRRKRRARRPLVASTSSSEHAASMVSSVVDSSPYDAKRMAKEISYESEVSTPFLNPSLSKETSLHATKSSKATVSVADCLACSGCVTTAEAVFLTTQHSIDTLRQKCTKEKEKKIVFTISPSVIADLIGALYSSGHGSCHEETMDPSIVARRLSSFLSQEFHADTILDGRIPQRLSLIHSAIEFCHRYRRSEDLREHDNTKEIPLTKEVTKADTTEIEVKQLDEHSIPFETPSIALSAKKTRYLIRNNDGDELKPVVIDHDAGRDSRIGNRYHSLQRRQILPMLASSCPGFVCYVEKNVPDVIPNLCSVRSPMSIAGLIYKHNVLKASLQSSEGNATEEEPLNDASSCLPPLESKDILHISIMPCHDKKLEAERKDFAWEQYNQNEEKSSLAKDVDLVVTSSELMKVLDAAATMQISSEGLIDEPDTDTETKMNAERVRSYFDKLPLSPVVQWERMNDDSPSGAFVTTEACSADLAEINAASEDTISKSLSSGGYGEFIFRFAAKALFDYDIPCGTLPWRTVRRRSHNGTSSGPNLMPSRRRHRAEDEGKVTSDFCEITLYKNKHGEYNFDGRDEGNLIALKFALAYGFKNVQLIMQRMTQHASEGHDQSYHYIEVMACPSGCLNGGGLTSANTKERETPSETRLRVTQNLSWIRPSWRNEDLHQRFITDNIDQTKTSKLFTRFHKVPKMELSSGATAGVAVEDTRW